MKRAKIRKTTYTYKGKIKPRWAVDYYDQHNKRRQPEFKNQAAAEAFASKVDREQHEGIHLAERSTLTFGKAYDGYVKDCERRQRAKEIGAGHVYKIKSLAKNYVLPRFARLKLTKIRSIDVQHFVNDQRESWSRAHVETMLDVITGVLDFAVREEVLVRSPLRDRPVKVPGGYNKRAFPEVDDIRACLRVLDGPRPSSQPGEGEVINRLTWANMRICFVLGAFCGLGPAEIGGLLWRHVDLRAEQIRIAHNLVKHDGLKGPKTEARNRFIPLDPITHYALEQHVKWSRPAGRHGGFVVRSRDADRIYVGMINKLHNKLLSLAGLVDKDGNPEFTPYGLRHFAGSMWLASGMQVQHVSWLLGHSTVQTTSRIYLHQLRDDDRARQIMGTLNTAFPGVNASTLKHLPSSRLIAPPPEPLVIEHQPEPPPPAIAPPRNLPSARPEVEPELRQLKLHRRGDAGELIDGRRDGWPLRDLPSWTEDALTKIQSGWTVVAVARELGKDPSSVSTILAQAGLEKPGSAAREVRHSEVPRWLHTFVDLINEGRTLVDACEIVGKSKSTVLKVCKRFGIADPGAKAREVRERKFVELHDAGHGLTDIADTLGMTWDGARKMQKRLKLRRLQPIEKASEFGADGLRIAGKMQGF